MASGHWAVVLHHVQRLFHGGSITGLSEGQLLDRFLATRDEVAFGALVARHGPMVLGVCRGLLDDPHDVEDAFQATFLVLVRKAKGLRDRDLLGQWLYGVARRVALRARADLSRRRARERPVCEVEAEPVATLNAELRELQVLIREEVDRLSSNDRMAVVLCYLEGLSHEEAASRLGWPIGTVKGRLSRAREKLRERLTRRGVAMPSGAFATNLVPGVSTAIPPELLRSTVQASIQLMSGKALTAGIVSANAMTLMEGVIGAMFTTKLKLTAMALVATCAVGVPGVLAFQQGPAGGGGLSRGPGLKKSSGLPDAKGLPAANGVQPDADPDRDEMARLAEQALNMLDRMVTQGAASPSSAEVYQWSRRLAEAKSAPGATEPERKAALQDHRDRMQKQFERSSTLAKTANGTMVDVLETQFRLKEAERWVRIGRIGDLATINPPFVGPGMMGMTGMMGRGGLAGGAPPGGMMMGGGLGAGPSAGRDILSLNKGPADEKRNEAIRAKLEEIISMNFPNPTPFEDFKKYIEASTQDEKAGLATGLPIYVDPEGLKEAEAKMTSTITINLEGIPLRTTLHLALRQIGLDFRVDGGVVVISDRESITVQEMRANRMTPGAK
jgi:RNA polymerase sigma factor (sigma-70 family)